MYIINKVHIYNKVKSIVNQAMLLLCLCLPAAAILLGGSILTSCNADNSISTQYLCQFIFRTQYHLDCSIVTALSGAGTYTMVSAKRVNGVWNIYSTLNDGRNHTETIILSTAKENYANYSHMGAGSNTTDAT